MIKRGNYDIQLYRGDSTTLEMTFTDIDDETGIEMPCDLTDYEITCQARHNPNDVSPWLIMEPVIIDAVGGKLQITITASQSALLVDPMIAGSTSGKWDMQFKSSTDPEQVFTVMGGNLSVVLDVTR